MNIFYFIQLIFIKNIFQSFLEEGNICTSKCSVGNLHIFIESRKQALIFYAKKTENLSLQDKNKNYPLKISDLPLGF